MRRSTILLALLVLISGSARAQAPDVLVYDSLPSGALSWYMGAVNVTAVNEATWSTMTTAQFEAYDLIWIGGAADLGTNNLPYVTLNATKAP